MECKEAKGLIADFIRDPDSCPKRKSLEKHINTCTSCYQEYVQAKDTVGRITDSIDWNKVSPNAQMQRKLYESAKQESERLKKSSSTIGNLKNYVKNLVKKKKK